MEGRLLHRIAWWLRLQAQSTPVESVPVMEINFSHSKNTIFLSEKNRVFGFRPNFFWQTNFPKITEIINHHVFSTLNFQKENPFMLTFITLGYLQMEKPYKNTCFYIFLQAFIVVLK